MIKDETTKIVAHIRKNETGEVRKYITDGYYFDHEDEISTFIWEDGSYSCDCNRSIFFGDEKTEECSDGKYSVNIEILDSGEVIYTEF